MFSMILEENYKELDEVELVGINGGSCCGGCSSSGGSSGWSSFSSGGKGGSGGNNNQSEQECYDWNNSFFNGNEYLVSDGIDPKYFSSNKYTQKLSKVESDRFNQEMKDFKSQGFKVTMNHYSFGDAEGHSGQVTIYSLFSPDGKKELMSFVDTNNDGVVDYAKE